MSSVQMSCLPLHDIIRRGPGWLGTGPTPQINHQAEGRATVQAELGQLEYYLDKKNTRQG
jgi:hypothetical protein